MPSEFALIDRYFRPLASGEGVSLGIGDDTAVLDCPPGHQLLATVDTMVAGVHFPESASPADIGYKALAVNLSDIAAMGGRPRWATLALTLPEHDPNWLTGFADGLAGICRQHGVALVGGDTTRGPLTISLQLLGEVGTGLALTRSGARPGDDLYVTGTLGDAGLGLGCEQGRLSLPEAASRFCRARLHRPSPRLEVGMALQGLATSAIDVSDGLLADLGHIQECSGVGADVRLADLPRSAAMRDAMQTGLADWNVVLSAGDDYELLFTAPAGRNDAIEAVSRETGCPITRIGRITDMAATRVLDEHGDSWTPVSRGYDHFEEPPA